MIDSELINWLEGHINLEKINPRRLDKPTLQRTIDLCRYLGDPQEFVKAIHITGTNGKTSTTRITESLLRSKGLYTGMISSPHLSQINERVCLDGINVSDELFNNALNEIRILEESIEQIKVDSPSWYEILIAASFSIMSQEAVDVGIIEVGMGGLFDATNVCNSEVSVFTNVDLDHMEYLGDTKQIIAQEKSGIIKQNNKVVIGEMDSDIASIFLNAAESKSAQPYVINQDFELLANEQALGGRLLSFRTPYSEYRDIFLPLFGFHQGVNALVATVASECFIDAALGQDVVEEGFAQVRSPGRMEIIHRNPLVIIDGAHNVAGAQTFSQALDEEFTRSRRIYVIGLTNEKDPGAMVNSLNIEDDDLVIATQAEYPRAMPIDVLAKGLRSAGIETVIESSDPRSAIENALSLALDDDHIIVTGSLYVVGDIRAAMGN